MKLTPEEHDILTAALSTFGGEAQQKMLLEEMAELQKEICKRWRGAQNWLEIAEEMADVQIMLDQMTLLLQNAGLQQSFRREKLDRLRERIKQKGGRENEQAAHGSDRAALRAAGSP